MNRARPLAATDGYQRPCAELVALISTWPPPFIYVHDPGSPRLACRAITAALNDLKQNNPIPLAFAHVNAVTCFNSRLLYDTVLNALSGWVPEWDEGCSNWTGSQVGTTQRFNENFDSFTHGLRAIRSHILQGGGHSPEGSKGKGQEKTQEGKGACRLVLVIERAERLKETMPELLAPLARLAELVSNSQLL